MSECQNRMFIVQTSLCEPVVFYHKYCWVIRRLWKIWKSLKSQYFLSCALNSNVKQLQDGSLQLHPGLHKHFWRGTWRCWHTGPHHGEGGWGFGSDSGLLFARSQLPHWWPPLSRLAPMPCASSAAIPQEAKHRNFLVIAVSDSVLAYVINPAHSHTTEGAILCQ